MEEFMNECVQPQVCVQCNQQRADRGRSGQDVYYAPCPVSEHVLRGKYFCRACLSKLLFPLVPLPL